MQLSFLSDYSEAEVEELFSIAPEYSGEATLCEEVLNVKDEVSLQIPEHELKDSECGCGDGEEELHHFLGYSGDQSC